MAGDDRRAQQRLRQTFDDEQATFERTGPPENDGVCSSRRCGRSPSGVSVCDQHVVAPRVPLAAR
jgi:hypothetical protein